MNIPNFIQKCLSDSGEISFGRTAAAVTLVFCLGWDTAYVWFAMKHLNFAVMSIHDVLPAAGTLLAQGGFATLFYGSTKVPDMIKKPEEKGNQ